jgi:beta-phosphoglucomutase-like phosphatase (HAD superfamily)
MNLHGLEADAVLFDCDGVLVDSEPVSYIAWSETLAAHGFALTVEAFSESVGGTETMVAEQFSPAVGVDPVTLELEAQRAFEAIAAQATGFSDTIGLVGRLESESVPVAVATNGLRWRLDVLLEAVGLARLLPNSVTADEVAHPKPAPDLYLAAAAMTGTDPARCIVIEDSPTGIAAATAAGCQVIALDRGMFDPTRLSAATLILKTI